MEETLLEAIESGLEAIGQLKLPNSLRFLEQAVHALTFCFQEGGKVIIAGNGGSLCDAMHCAEELTGIFRKKRRALPAIALSCPGHLTCVGNDLGFDEVFARGVEAYGEPGDCFIGLTTSGNSPNLMRAFDVAIERGLTTLAFLGRGGGKLRGRAHHELIIDGFPFSDRVQEAHMCAIHILIEQVEQRLFASDVKEVLVGA